MTRFRNGRRAKSQSGWNRRLKAARVERSARQAEANEAGRPRRNAKGGADRPWDSDINNETEES